MTLPADKRVKVSEACTGQKWNVLGDRVYRTINIPHSLIIEWDTVANLTDILALITKVAQQLEEISSRDERVYDVQIEWLGGQYIRFNKAIAAGNTDDLENLCYELMSGEVNG